MGFGAGISTRDMTLHHVPSCVKRNYQDNTRTRSGQIYTWFLKLVNVVVPQARQVLVLL